MLPNSQTYRLSTDIFFNLALQNLILVSIYAIDFFFGQVIHGAKLENGLINVRCSWILFQVCVVDDGWMHMVSSHTWCQNLIAGLLG